MKLEQLGKQGARECVHWAEFMPEKYHELLQAVEYQERELMEHEQQMAIDEACNKGWNTGLLDLIEGKVTPQNLHKMAKKRAKGDEIFLGAYIFVVEDMIQYRMRQAS